MSAHDRLEAIVRSGRWRELEPWLQASADSDEGTELRRWYRTRRSHWAKEFQWQSSRNAEDVDHPGCLRLLAVTLDKPDQAARRVAGASWGWRTAGSDHLLLTLMGARGPEWCQDFLDAAAQVKVPKGDEHAVAWVAHVGRELVRNGFATLPRTPTMATAWASAYSHGAAHAKWRAWRIQHGQDDADDHTQDSLTALLREDPALADGISLVLSGPGAVGMLEYFLSPTWDLAESAATLVMEGRLDRSRVLDDVLAALTRQDNANTQKGLARTLTALDVTGADLRDRLPLVQGLLATSRGSVTAALLPAVLDAAGPDDLEELARTIFSRKEKAQQKLLLSALADKDAVQRWDHPSVVTALGVASDVPDAQLAARARKTLDRLGEAAPEPGAAMPVDDLWGPPPPVTVGAEATPVEPDARGLTAAASRFGTGAGPADAALLTDALVRWYAADPDGARTWASSAVPQATVWLPALVYAVHERRRPDPEALRRRNEQVSAHLTTGKRPPIDTVPWELISRPSTAVLHDGVTLETTIRLGEIPFLLSTPTHVDGSLTLDALVDRLRQYDVAAGPLDLALALLRLQPCDPGRAAGIEARNVPLWTTEKPGLLRRRPRTADAIDIVRAWVASGGLAPLTIRHRGAAVLVESASLPGGIGEISGVPGSLSSGHDPAEDDEYYEYNISIENGPGIVPQWVDLLAARLQGQFDQSSRGVPHWLPSIVTAPAPGLAVIHVLAQTLCHADEDHRLLAAEAALVLMGRGRWVTDDYTACCLHMLADGELRLGRLSHAWEQVVLGGGLQPLWPSVVSVLDAACALDRKPAGLADLLAVARRYAPAVPDVELPASVHVLATSSGSSKAKLEAKALVEAVS